MGKLMDATFRFVTEQHISLQQRGYPIIRFDGRPRRSAGHLCLPVGRRRGERSGFHLQVFVDADSRFSLQVKVDKVEYRKPEPPASRDNGGVAANLGASVNAMSIGGTTPGRMQQSPRIGAGW